MVLVPSLNCGRKLRIGLNIKFSWLLIRFGELNKILDLFIKFLFLVFSIFLDSLLIIRVCVPPWSIRLELISHFCFLFLFLFLFLFFFFFFLLRDQSGADFDSLLILFFLLHGFIAVDQLFFVNQVWDVYEFTRILVFLHDQLIQFLIFWKLLWNFQPDLDQASDVSGNILILELLIRQILNPRARDLFIP